MAPGLEVAGKIHLAAHLSPNALNCDEGIKPFKPKQEEPTNRNSLFGLSNDKWIDYHCHTPSLSPTSSSCVVSLIKLMHDTWLYQYIFFRDDPPLNIQPKKTAEYYTVYISIYLITDNNIRHVGLFELLRDDFQGRLQGSGEGWDHRQMDLMKHTCLTVEPVASFSGLV